jgi:exonuclease III/ribonuclease HI
LSSTTRSALDGRSDCCFALQWNVRGLRANINELKFLIADLEPCVVALQETKVNQTAIPPDFVGRHYTLLLESNNAHYWQHGVGLAIREGIPFERLQIDTSLHLVAARIHAPIKATVVSIYIPPGSVQYSSALSELFEQLEEPFLLLGDFNAHHLAWGSQTCNALGRHIADTTLDNQCVILNNGSSTRIDPATGNTSAIDVTICSESIASRFTWRTLSDTHNSDHFPITVSLPGLSNSRTVRQKWLYDHADWSLYECITAETIHPDVEWDVITFTEKIIDAAKQSIPRTSGRVGPKAVPWWCPDTKAAIRRRRKCLRSLRRIQLSDPDQPEALARFQEARKVARKAVNQAKKQSWENFVAKISPNSTTTELWRRMNILRGSRQQRTVVLKRADGFTDNPEEAAEELAKFYSERSATSSYPPSFQKAKAAAEQQSIEFSSNTEDVYNIDITLNELLWALDKGRGASTGPDLIGYPLLQHLPLSVKSILLELLNNIWRNGEFPTSWRNAVVVPIPKSNCHESGPDTFRPISLTSCLAKLFERIINRRLITELESSGRLDKRQHAFRAGRGTDTYFAELERSLPTVDEHCLVASLDLSKAYDTTWRHGILRTLKSWRIRGRMMNMLQSFLSERTFQVSVGGHVSREYQLENGVPQGSVLSVTLFLVAMQPIFRVLPSGVEILLYADDILLVVRGAKSEGLHQKLQTAVKAVDKWAKSVGFAISATKSHIFYCSPNARREPARDIVIDRTPVPKTNRLRILGVTLDRTLTFKPHCQMVKKACESRLRILRMIGAKLPRGSRTTLLQVGSALITAKLMYGIPLVSRGGPATLQILAPAYNKMVRFASGAFVTSPINSIMAEAGTLPFELLAAQSTARTAIHILAKSQNSSSLPLIRRTSDRLADLTGTALPAVGHLTRQSDRVWHTRKPSIVWDVKRSVHAGDPPEKVRPVVQQLLATRFNRSVVVYTDGSKCEDTVGAAYQTNGVTGMYSLPNQFSIFSAEAYAIKMALSIPNINTETVILTDSASCLLALEAGESKHPLIQEIEDIIRNKQVRFCWIPGHAGIRGNVEADRLANEARRQPTIDIPIPGEDVFRAVKQAIRRQWDNQWFDLRDAKLREIKDDTHRWTDRSSTADQRVLTRLRIGHTRLTHTFLLKKEPPPTCECCGTILDVRHLILQCRKYENERRANEINTTSLRDALSNAEDRIRKLIKYLHETQLYKKL